MLENSALPLLFEKAIAWGVLVRARSRSESLLNEKRFTWDRQLGWSMMNEQQLLRIRSWVSPRCTLWKQRSRKCVSCLARGSKHSGRRVPRTAVQSYSFARAIGANERSGSECLTACRRRYASEGPTSDMTWSGLMWRIDDWSDERECGAPLPVAVQLRLRASAACVFRFACARTASALATPRQHAARTRLSACAGRLRAAQRSCGTRRLRATIGRR